MNYMELEEILHLVQKEDIVNLTHEILLKMHERGLTYRSAIIDPFIIEKVKTTVGGDYHKIRAVELSLKLSEGCIKYLVNDCIVAEDKYKFLNYFIKDSCNFELNLLRKGYTNLVIS